LLLVPSSPNIQKKQPEAVNGRGTLPKGTSGPPFGDRGGKWLIGGWKGVKQEREGTAARTLFRGSRSKEKPWLVPSVSKLYRREGPSESKLLSQIALTGNDSS